MNQLIELKDFAAKVIRNAEILTKNIENPAFIFNSDDILKA